MTTFVAYVRKYVLLIIAVLIIVALAIVYSLGFRVGPGGIMRVGTLTITNLPIGANIYIEQELKKTTSTAGNEKFELVPGHHTIIVNVPNDYPWTTVVNISSGSDTQVKPFLVSEHLSVEPLDGAQKAEALAAIASTTLPTQAAPLKMANGCANVYVANAQVVAEAATSTPGCTPPAFLCNSGSCEPTVVFAPVSPVQALFAYPHRQDGLIVEVGNSIYALGLDPTNSQFFAPLIRAQSPKFGQLPDGSIVLKQDNLVAKVSL